MKIFKKLIIALILGLFLCFGIKQETKVNGATGDIWIYGTPTFISGSITFDVEFEESIPEGKITTNQEKLTGIRVRITSGNDYLLEYRINGGWAVAYSEARGDWSNNNFKTLNINGFYLASKELASFLNTNLGSFRGYHFSSGKYYFSNIYKNIFDVPRKTDVVFQNFQNETPSREKFLLSFYANEGYLGGSNSFEVISFLSTNIMRIGTGKRIIEYDNEMNSWFLDDNGTINRLGIPNIELSFSQDTYVRVANLEDVYINDPTYWIINEGFVERYNISWDTESSIAIQPYKPQFVNGDTRFGVNKKFSIINLVGTANYDILSDISFELTNIKSNIIITITEYRIKSSVDISVSSIGSVSGDFTFDNNQFNIILDTRVNFNITLSIPKSSGYLKNIGPLTDIIGINNVASDSSVIYSYFGENFSLLTITKKVNGEEVGSKRISSDSLSQDRVINALDLFGNDDNFFTLTEENTTFSINLGLQFEGIPTDEVKVKNAMETIFETFKSFLSLNIGWLNIGGLIASILVLAILVFVVKLWKGGN